MVRLKDIAEAAGVSITTVSRVLNGTADQVGIAQMTQEEVRAIARKLNYRPNREARNLRLGHRPQAILFLSLFEGRTEGEEGFLSHPFYGELMHGIQAEVSLAGYYLAYVAVNASNVETISELVQRTVSAVITWGTLPPPLQELLVDSGIPTASIEPYSLSGGQIHEIYVDNAAAISLALNHLYEQGFQHIALADIRLGGDRQNPVFEERVSAFREYSAEYEGLTAWVESFARSKGMSDIFAGEMAGQQIFHEITQPTGVIAVNDLVAMGVRNAAEKARISVPNQVGIVGIDDIEWARFQSPPLTTVRIPKRQLAQEAVSYVTDRLRIGRKPGSIVRVPVELVVRESSQLGLPTQFGGF